jgi:hypothetical protein
MNRIIYLFIYTLNFLFIAKIIHHYSNIAILTNNYLQLITNRQLLQYILSDTIHTIFSYCLSISKNIREILIFDKNRYHVKKSHMKITIILLVELFRSLMLSFYAFA